MKARDVADFVKEVERLKRRIDRIQAALAGTARTKVVHVNGGWVKRHRRGAYDRIIITSASKGKGK